jgi:hypothetical protein
MQMNEDLALKAVAKELLTIQAGSVEDAMMLLEDGHGFFTEEEMGKIEEYLEEIGEGTLKAIDREIAVEGT